MAFSCFLARRARPKTITSDNAGIFRKDSNEIEELILQRDLEKLQQAYPAITWHFNPPLAPHTGGFYERMIGIMKRALEAVLPARTVRDAEFTTIVCVVEGLINNRPLSRLPAMDPAEAEALTPNHFLLGSLYTDVAVLPAGQSYPFNRRWFFLQDILDGFWRRFLAEIVPQYHEMNHWLRPQGDLHVGDVVLLLEKNERGLWKLGIIEDVLPTERDNLIRRVTVRVGKKSFDRSTHGLILLLAIQ
jgi:hypothetical protein